MTHLILIIVASYILGGIPFGLILGLLVKKIDIREYGSGNIGASNAWRILGPVWGGLTFLLDVLKGYAPVVVSHHFCGPGSPLPVFAGLAALLGHNFSPFLKFKGGKGAATSLGVAFGLSPLAGAIGFGVWLVVVAATHYISVGSVCAVIAGSFFIWWFNSKGIAYGVFALFAIVFTFVKHRSNFERLKAGTESKVKFGKSSEKPDETPPETN